MSFEFVFVAVDGVVAWEDLSRSLCHSSSYFSI